MIKIISGKYKKSNLMVCPKFTRPTTNRVKKIIFDTVYEKIKNADILDCFAGTGSLGIEAMSIGARECHFIEKRKEVFLTLKDNVTKFFDLGNIKLFNMDFFQISTDYKYDLIFMDPPYGLYDFNKLFKYALNFAKKDAIFIYETNEMVAKIPQIFNFKEIADVKIYFLCNN